MNGWRSVTRQEVCPICDGADNCKVSERARADGTLAVWCGRIAEGSTETNNGGQYLHIVGADLPLRRESHREIKDFEPGADLTALGQQYARNITSDQLESLSDDLGVSVSSLQRLGVGYHSQAGRNSSAFTFPERDGHGRSIGILNRFPDGSKRIAAGGQRGLYYGEDWFRGNSPVCIVEGASDTAALDTIGISAIGRPSATGGADHLVKILQQVPDTRPIIVIAEYDRKRHEDLKPEAQSRHKPECEGCATCWPGRHGAISIAQQLAGRLGRDVEWSFPPGRAKDSRAWLKNNGDEVPGVLKRAFLGGLNRQVVRPNTTNAGVAEIDFDMYSVLELVEKHPQLREAIIDKVLRRGEIANIICAPKTGKSWLLLSLLLCIATGRPWLGTYAVKKGPVLLIDNELHPETLASRVKLVADKMGIRLEDCENLKIIPLRGKRCDLQTIRRMLTGVRAKPRGYYHAIAMDAFYRILPTGTDENSNGGITEVYNMIDEIAAETDAAILLIHHSSKGNQAGKNVTDVGSGAGAQSRACDTHLILRQHKEEGVFVLDAGVRSWPPLKAICLEWNFPTWTLRSDLDSEELKLAYNPRAAAQGRSKAAATARRNEIRNILEQAPQHTMGKTALKEESHMNGKCFGDTCSELLTAGVIERTQIKSDKRNQMIEAFRLISKVQYAPEGPSIGQHSI